MAHPRRDARVALPSLRAPNPPPASVELERQLAAAPEHRPTQQSAAIDLPVPVRPTPGATAVPTVTLPVQTVLARPTAAVAVEPPPTAPPARRPATPPVPPAPPIRRRHVSRLPLLVAAVVVTAAAAGSIAYATTHSDQPARTAAAPPAASPTPTPTAGPRTRSSATAAVQWVTTNLGRHESIVAVASIATRLTTAGFDRVTTTAVDGASWVVATPASASGWSALLARAAPVASFGTGPTAVRVSSVAADTAPQASQVQASAAANQQLAGDTLSTNPQLHAPSPLVTVLQHGGLDLRPATFLAVLSSVTSIQLLGLPQDPAEQAAGRARRSLVLSAPAAAIDQTRRALPPEYAPQHAETHGSTTTLVWSAAVPTSLGS